MKTTKNMITLFILISSVTATVIKGQEIERRGEIMKVSTDFSRYLEDPAEWEIGKKDKISLKMNGDATSFLHNDHKEVFRVKPPDYIKQVIASDDGSVLIFLAMKRSGRGGSNYYLQLRIGG